MNCKPGDLAVVVKTSPDFREFLGRIFVCERLDTRHKVNGDPGFCWETPWVTRFGGTVYKVAVPDSHARPIRDNDQQDETLDWAPIKETA